MDYENIIVENEDSITTITLNHPKKLNALDPGILKDLIAAIDAAADDDDASKVLIITGSGNRGFCSGADLTSTSGSGTDFNLPGLKREVRQTPFALFGAVMKRLH
ncbi:MAG: enoyl-CoA hydratase-related protein, partial [Desulfobacterales bacterium]